MNSGKLNYKIYFLQQFFLEDVSPEVEILLVAQECKVVSQFKVQVPTSEKAQLSVLKQTISVCTFGQSIVTHW